MAIAQSTVASLDTNSDANTYTTNAGNWTPASGRLYLLLWKSSAGSIKTPTCSGNGLTWTSLGLQARSTFYECGAFVAEGTGGSSGETTLNFGAASSHISCFIRVYELTGASTTTPGSAPGAGTCIPQVVGNDGASGDASATFAAGASADSRAFLVTGHNVNESIAAVTGYTELAEYAHSAPNRAAATYWSASSFVTAAGADFTTSAGWCLFGVEVAAAAAGTKVSVITAGV